MVKSNSIPISAKPIIGPQFCASYPVDLSIIRKVMTIREGDFLVTDTNGNIVFKVKGNRILVDAAGNPVIKLKQKNCFALGQLFTAHDRWQAFRGKSTKSKDLLFTVKRSSMIQWKTKLNIFLANNTEEKVCDFKIKGSWSERSYTVYAGESSTIVAQMHKKTSVKSSLIGKDNFMVAVKANIDYGFIVALIVILTAINDAHLEASTSATAEVVGAVVTA